MPHNTISNTKSSNRIHYLDGVRGLAALSVVFYHFIGWRWKDNIEFHLGSIIFNGSDAVSFFFVLSGLVLSYKYFHSDSQINMKSYLYRRILRLYPAFIFTILLNYMYWNRHTLPIDLLKDIFYLNGQQLWEELLMVRNAHKFYIPGWTLGVEMALSLLVPVLVYTAKKDINHIWWFLLFTIIMGNYISNFAFHFGLGVIISYYFPQIRDFNFSKHKLFKYRYLIGIIVFGLYSIRHITKIFPFGSTYNYIAGTLKIGLFHYSGFASFIILLWIINNEKVQQFFTSKIMIFLGKISYGVYLMHWLVVVYIMEHWDKLQLFDDSFVLNFGSLLLFAVGITIFLATFVHYFIEEFFIKLSKRRKV